jgi:hypothetical protein
MRFFAVHDDAGNIEQVVTCPTDSPALILTPPPGLFYTECDPPEGLAEDADAETLLELVKSHQVETLRTKARVIRRS